MNYNKYFALAKQQGLESLELYISHNYELSFGLFHSEVASYSLSDTSDISARGVYNGKIGYAYCEKQDANTASFLVSQIKENAMGVDKDDPAIIFKGSEKYHKKNIFNPEIEKLSIDQKLKNLYEIEAKLKAADPRITEVDGCDYAEAAEEVMLLNSYGLKLKAKANHFYYYAGVVVKDGEEVKTGYKVKLSNDPYEFDIDEFVKQVVKNAVDKLGGKPCASKKYPAVLAPKVAASLVGIFLESASADEVQRHSSLLEGKVGEKIASSKLTILESPLKKTCFFRYFDDEGVATYNKPLIEKGILQTYLYNLTTAAKDGVKTTANGYKAGGKVDIGYVNVEVKPGRKTLEQAISKIKEGVYIEEVQGLHAGINAQSGNFSLQASGYMIRDGKKAEPLNLVTVAGNLIELFLDVKEVANDTELQLSSISSPSLVIKKLAISGK
ncbi:MAG: TldD/PmbA family protein [Firmicutes bacterium]|nr:TldD/PmbA family protein [Bacillota bacterium]